MNTAFDFTTSPQLLTDVFGEFLSGATVADFGCRWIRNAHDSKCTDLVDSNNRKLGSVWKSEGLWGITSGHTCRTRKEGKALIEDRLIRQVAEELEGFEIYLKAFNAHAKAIYSVMGRTEKDSDRYRMSTTTYRALNMYLNQQVRERFDFAMARNPDLRRLPRTSMPVNSIGGFALGVLHMMYLEPNARHTLRSGRYEVGAQAMTLTTSTLDDSSDTLAQHPAFPVQIELSIHRLDPQSLHPRLDAFIHDTIARARAAV